MHSNGSVDVAVESSISVPQHLNDTCLDALTNACIRSTRKLALIIELSSEGPQLSWEQFSELIDGIANAEVRLTWS